jgi:hypothetical protein
MSYRPNRSTLYENAHEIIRLKDHTLVYAHNGVHVWLRRT